MSQDHSKLVHRTHDIVVVGASAGGIEALRQLVATFPRNLPASVFVVQHVPAYARSMLPEVLSAAGPLPAVHPRDGDPIEPGRIYVAPPDHHLLIENGRILVRRGPKENRFRPAVDALFRSAAYAFGPRVIGVLLSGMLDDGTAGLWAIKRLGGVAVVQDPGDAIHPQMPRNAVEQVCVDHVTPVASMGELILRLSRQPTGDIAVISESERQRIGIEVNVAIHNGTNARYPVQFGDLSQFVCPERHGVLFKLRDEKLIRFRCRMGHAFSWSALLAGLTAEVGTTLWRALRGVEEVSLLLREVGEELKTLGESQPATLVFQKAQENRNLARLLYESLPIHDELSDESFEFAAR